MKFLYEKQTRRFYWFLLGVLLLQTALLGFCGVLQARDLCSLLTGRELAAASYLLEQDVPPSVVAAALNHTGTTQEGAKLLGQIGHTGQTQSYFTLLIEQGSFPLLLILPLAGMTTAIVILAGAAFFFRRRERVYEEAEQVIAQYTENRFERHLPTGQAGALCQLFGSIEQLAQSLQAKSAMEHRAKIFLREMISHISHQLKTPLSALGMYMEIISEESENADTVKNFSQKSLQSLERMEQLIQSLLKMARLDSGTITFEKRQCLLSEMVEQAIEDLRERAKQEGKTILTQGPPGETLSCDWEWTKQALGNLVKNALDHTEAGGIIKISWEGTSAVSRLTVEDNGHGIAQEDIHHIFKQFYRGSAPQDRQGTGLGLSLAKSIVEGQGGNLSVESHPGEGSVFCMTFLAES